MKSSGFDTENLESKGVAKGYYYSDSLKDFIKMPVYLFKSTAAFVS